MHPSSDVIEGHADCVLHEAAHAWRGPGLHHAADPAELGLIECDGHLLRHHTNHHAMITDSSSSIQVRTPVGGPGRMAGSSAPRDSSILALAATSASHRCVCLASIFLDHLVVDVGVVVGDVA